MSVWLVNCSFFKRHDLLSFLRLKLNFDLKFLKKLNFYLTFTVWATLESSKTVVTKWQVLTLCKIWTARDTLFSLSNYPTVYSTKSNYFNSLQERNVLPHQHPFLRGKYSYYIQKKSFKNMNDQTCCYITVFIILIPYTDSILTWGLHCPWRLKSYQLEQYHVKNYWIIIFYS